VCKEDVAESNFVFLHSYSSPVSDGFQEGGEKLFAGDPSSNLASSSSKSFPILRISALAIRLPSSLADSRVKIQQPAAAWNDGAMFIVSFIF
jgi:hypothetical protein